MYKRSIILLYGLLFLLLLTSSCRNVIFQHQKDFEENTWNRENKISTTLVVNDTIETYNIFITLDINNDYSFRNLYLFIDTELPDKSTIRDTVNCYLADEKGRWLGKKRGSKIKNNMMYKQNIRFPYSGSYHFEIEQAMRVYDLKGVLSCGIQIEAYD